MSQLFHNKDFIQSALNKNFYYFGNIADQIEGIHDFDWNAFIKFFDAHPENLRGIKEEARRFTMLQCEKRNKLPESGKYVLNNLRSLFSEEGHRHTLHMFGGWTDQHKSFKIHRDPMDVLYLQMIGEVEWSIWERRPNAKLENLDILTLNTGKKIWRRKFKKGDMIWVPRGTYHLCEPYGSRVGFSFGVEGTNAITNLRSNYEKYLDGNSS